MARVLFFVVAALAIVSRVAGDDMDEEDDDEVIAEQSGSGPQFQQQQQMSEEEMRMRQEQQMKVIQYIMSTVTDPCKQELQVLMSTPQQEQQNVEITEPCKMEIQSAVQAFQAEQGGGEQGGSAGQQQAPRRTTGGGPEAPAAPEPSAFPIFLRVFAFLLVAILGLAYYVYIQYSKRLVLLEEHPDIARRLAKKAEKAAAKRGPNSATKMQ